MVPTKQGAGFRSIVYRHGEIYNWLNKRFLYEWDKKFAEIAKIVNQTERKSGLLKVLDLPCGTGYLARYLPRDVEYWGFDLNHRFIKKLKLDRSKGRIKPVKVYVKQQDIFDYDNYPKEMMDIIVFSGILHHIYPRHAELVENAKKHARKIIACEPYAIRPGEITALNWTTKVTMYITKYLPERLFKLIDFLFADNDGINPYERRYSWEYDEEGLKEMYKSLGMQKTYAFGDECIGIWNADKR